MGLLYAFSQFTYHITVQGLPKADWLNRCHKWERPRSQMYISACNSWSKKQESEHLAQSKAAFQMIIMHVDIEPRIFLMSILLVRKETIYLNTSCEFVGVPFIRNEWRTYSNTSCERVDVLWPDLRLGQSSFCGRTHLCTFEYGHMFPHPFDVIPLHREQWSWLRG